jgi:hypothetical protein
LRLGIFDLGSKFLPSLTLKTALRFKERFRRPLRNANFRAFFDDDDDDNFVYESSPEFNEISVLSQLRKLHFR